ncbi:hypothetical protein K1719_040773 [Acacia pycnantha]|nr:hypothetical protein K1719_040773 [Acacia pycnantha]
MQDRRLCRSPSGRRPTNGSGRSVPEKMITNGAFWLHENDAVWAHGYKSKAQPNGALVDSSSQVPLSTEDSKGSSVFEDEWAEYIAGLKHYFLNDSTSEGDEESNDVDCPTFKFSHEEYELWCAPWKKSLIIKLLGKTIPFWAMKACLTRICKTSKPFTFRDIDNGFFVVSFEDEGDMNHIFQEGSWMVADRIPLLPLEFCNAASLKKIGSLIGRTLKIDRITYASKQGRYARMCVEIDLNKRLTTAINIFGRKCYVEYEGLHLICFNCGKYGHHKDVCPDKVISQCITNQQEDSKIDQEGGIMQGPDGESAKAMEGSAESERKEESKQKRSRGSLDGNSASGDGTLPVKERLGVWNLVQRPHQCKSGNQGYEERESRREEINSKGNGQGKLSQLINKEGASEIEKGKKSLWGPSNHQNEQMQKRSLQVSAKLGGPKFFVKDSSNRKKWVPIAPINNKRVLMRTFTRWARFGKGKSLHLNKNIKPIS